MTTAFVPHHQPLRPTHTGRCPLPPARAASHIGPLLSPIPHDIDGPVPLRGCNDVDAPSHLRAPTDTFPALLGFCAPHTQPPPSPGKLGALARPHVQRALEASGGAVLLRNLPLHSKKDFYDFGQGLGFDSPPYQRLFLDRAVEDGVYDVTVNPAALLLSPHNENSIYPTPTPKLMFCMHQPAEHGGESLILRNRDMTEALPPWVVPHFARHGGVRYDRWYPSDKQLQTAPRFAGAPPMPSWQTFTDTQASPDRPPHLVATEYMERLGLEVRWDGPDASWAAGGAYTSDDDGLWASNVLPAVQPYGENGEPVWFNFADTDGIPPFFSITYGNGAPIEPEVKQVIKKARWDRCVAVPMRAKDVAIYDNLRCQHGRLPYLGERIMSVSMLA